MPADNSFNIYPKPVYYRYDNNHSSIGRLDTVAYDGISWKEHRKALTGTLYKYKYTYRKIKSTNKLNKVLAQLEVAKEMVEILKGQAKDLVEELDLQGTQ